MGEMADYYTECLYNVEDYNELHEDELRYDESNNPKFDAPKYQCAYCGKTSLTWKTYTVTGDSMNHQE